MPERQSYREIPVDAPLRGFGVCYWELAAPRGFSHLVFPDGCCALIYYRRPALAQAGLRVMGPTVRPRRVRLWPGDRFWALRLAPAACEAVLGLAPAALRDRAVDFDRLAPGLGRFRRRAWFCRPSAFRPRGRAGDRPAAGPLRGPCPRFRCRAAGGGAAAAAALTGAGPSAAAPRDPSNMTEVFKTDGA